MNKHLGLLATIIVAVVFGVAFFASPSTVHAQSAQPPAPAVQTTPVAVSGNVAIVYNDSKTLEIIEDFDRGTRTAVNLTSHQMAVYCPCGVKTPGGLIGELPALSDGTLVFVDQAFNEMIELEPKGGIIVFCYCPTCMTYQAPVQSTNKGDSPHETNPKPPVPPVPPAPPQPPHHHWPPYPTCPHHGHCHHGHRC